jgi:hypothetical protein
MVLTPNLCGFLVELAEDYAELSLIQGAHQVMDFDNLDAVP